MRARLSPHRSVYRSPAPAHLPLILALAVGSWLFLGAGAYLFGDGFLTLLGIIGGLLS